MIKWLQMLKITLKGVFISENEYIRLNRYNRFTGAKIKKVETDRVVWEVKPLTKGREPITTSRDFKFIWFMPDRRKDPDNIAFCIKYILDGLVKVGLLKDDNWSVVNSLTHNFAVDSIDPRVQIYIKEVHEQWETGK
jgi:Holliday junction resolvase RusA-like endonuclease